VMLLNGVKVIDDNNMTLLVITDITAQEKAYNILQESYKSVETMNNFMVGREIKMVELKAEIVRLKEIIEQNLPKE